MPVTRRSSVKRMQPQTHTAASNPLEWLVAFLSFGEGRVSATTILGSMGRLGTSVPYPVLQDEILGPTGAEQMRELQREIRLLFIDPLFTPPETSVSAPDYYRRKLEMLTERLEELGQRPHWQVIEAKKGKGNLKVGGSHGGLQVLSSPKRWRVLFMNQSGWLFKRESFQSC